MRFFTSFRMTGEGFRMTNMASPSLRHSLQGEGGKGKFQIFLARICLLFNLPARSPAMRDEGKCLSFRTYFNRPIFLRISFSSSFAFGVIPPTGGIPTPASMPIRLRASLITTGKVPRSKARRRGAKRNCA